MRHLSWKSYLVAAGLLVAAGCDRDAVTYYRVPKAPPQDPSAAAQGAMAGDVSSPPRPASGGLRWTLPAGWTESLGGAMRYATLKPPVSGKIDGSVVVLPGPAGGELANVNRWRNQIGLAPIDEAALAGARKIVRTKAGPLAVYDFTNGGKSGTRVVAGLTEIGGSTWFVKLTGDAGPVAAARNDFLKLLASLRYEAAEAPAAEASPVRPAAMEGDVPPPARPASGVRWTLPAGWTESQGGAMRFATLTPPVVGKIDGSVVVLPGPAGGELANVNRWRSQIGLPPIDEGALPSARKIVHTKAGPLAVYDFANGGSAGTRVIAGLAEIRGNTWFLKLTGDAEPVAAARSDFMKLLGSLRLE